MERERERVTAVTGRGIGGMQRYIYSTLHAPLYCTHSPVLLFAPGRLVDIGVQVVVPALPALLANASRQLLRDLRPLLRADLAHQVDDCLVLLQYSKVRVMVRGGTVQERVRLRKRETYSK